MIYQCIKKCYWKETLFSPLADGQMIYEGPEKIDDMPHAKNGEPFFKLAEFTVFKNEEPREEIKKTWEPTQAVIAKWALQKLNKAELQGKLRREYHKEVSEEVTRKELIDMVLEYQTVSGESNQEMANVAKAN